MIKTTIAILLLLNLNIAFAVEYGGSHQGTRCEVETEIDGNSVTISGDCAASNVTCGISGNSNGHTCFISVNGISYGGDEIYSLKKKRATKALD